VLAKVDQVEDILYHLLVSSQITTSFSDKVFIIEQVVQVSATELGLNLAQSLKRGKEAGLKGLLKKRMS